MKCSVSPANHLITNSTTVWCCVVGGYSLVFKQNTEGPCLQYNLPILMYSTLYSQGIGGGGNRSTLLYDASPGDCCGMCTIAMNLDKHSDPKTSEIISIHRIDTTNIHMRIDTTYS